jgi:hypothetical protein
LRKPKEETFVPKIPKFGYKRLCNNVRRIKTLLHEYEGKTLGHKDIMLISNDVSQILGVDSPGAVAKTLYGLSGSSLSPHDISLQAYRLSGNIDTLKKGCEVQRWLCQLDYEWVPVSIGESTEFYTQGKKFFRLTLLVLAGLPAGLTFVKRFPHKFKWVLANDLGFGRNQLGMSSVEEFTGLRFRALLEPGDALDFSEYRVIEYAFNRDLIKARRSNCPRGYQHACHECPLGLDKCHHAVRPATLLKKQCINGHTGWFDPRYPLRTRCIGCYKRGKTT